MAWSYGGIKAPALKLRLLLLFSFTSSPFCSHGAHAVRKIQYLPFSGMGGSRSAMGSLRLSDRQIASDEAQGTFRTSDSVDLSESHFDLLKLGDKDRTARLGTRKATKHRGFRFFRVHPRSLSIVGAPPSRHPPSRWLARSSPGSSRCLAFLLLPVQEKAIIMPAYLKARSWPSSVYCTALSTHLWLMRSDQSLSTPS